MKAFKAVMLVGLLLVGAGVVWGQDSLAIKRLGSTLDFWRECNEVLTDSNQVFAAGGAGLRVVEPDGDQIIRVAHVEDIPADRFYKSGNHIRILGTRSNDIHITTISLDAPDSPLSRFIIRDRVPSYWENSATLSFLGCNPPDAGEPSVLYIIDFSNCENPATLAVIDTFRTISSLSLDGNLLYLLTRGRQLNIFNIENAAEPEVVATSWLDQFYSEVRVEEGLGAYSHPRNLDELHLFDMSDPDSLERLGVYDAGNSDYRPEASRFDGNLLYYSTRERTLSLLDISNPADPTLAWRSLQGVYRLPYIDGDRMTVPMGSGFAIFTLEQRNNPLLSSIYLTVGSVHQMKFDANNRRLFILEGGHTDCVYSAYRGEEPLYPSFRFLDETDSLPRPMADEPLDELSEDFWGQFTDFVVRDRTAYIVSGNCLVFDVNGLGQNALRYAFDPPDNSSFNAIAWQDTLLYLTSDEYVSSYSLARPERPRLIAHCEVAFNDYTFRLFPFGRWLLAGAERGYRLIDISNPNRMTDQGLVELAGSGSIILRDSLLYRQSSENEQSHFTIYNVSDPTRPELLGDFEIAGEWWNSFDVQGDYAAVTSHAPTEDGFDYSLSVLNISDPQAIVTTGFYRSYRSFGPVVFGTNKIYAAEFYDEQLGTYDVKYALGVNIAPGFRDHPDTVSVMEGRILSWNILASDFNGDTLTLSVAQGTLPQGAEFVDNGGGRGRFTWQTDFDDAGEYFPIFVVSDGELTDTAIVRIVVIDVNSESSDFLTPYAFQLVPCFPNPFNSSITISFSTPVGQVSKPVRLSIYDLSGRLVADLTNQSKIQNPQSKIGKVVWNASGLAAGVYLIRLESSTHTATQKVVLMK